MKELRLEKSPSLTEGEGKVGGTQDGKVDGVQAWLSLKSRINGAVSTRVGVALGSGYCPLWALGIVSPEWGPGRSHGCFDGVFMNADVMNSLK